MHQGKPCPSVIIFHIFYIVRYILTEGGVPMTGFGLFVRAYMLISITAFIAVVDESCKRGMDPEEFTMILLKEIIEFFGFH